MKPQFDTQNCLWFPGHYQKRCLITEKRISLEYCIVWPNTTLHQKKKKSQTSENTFCSNTQTFNSKWIKPSDGLKGLEIVGLALNKASLVACTIKELIYLYLLVLLFIALVFFLRVHFCIVCR